MSIWQRIVRVFRSLFSRGENVEQLSARLDDTYREQTKLLQQVRRGVADVATSRKRVEVQLTALRQQIAGLDDAARQAVTHGNDDEARDALGRKLALEKAATELTERHAALRAEEEKLQLSASKVEQGVEQFRLRKDTLNARHAAASARAEINSATTGINATGSEAGQAMAAAERETRSLEATADAVDELVADGYLETAGQDPRDAELRRFDAEQAEIERQLEQISHTTIPEVGHGPDQIQK